MHVKKEYEMIQKSHCNLVKCLTMTFQVPMRAVHRTPPSILSVTLSYLSGHINCRPCTAYFLHMNFSLLLDMCTVTSSGFLEMDLFFSSSQNSKPCPLSTPCIQVYIFVHCNYCLPPYFTISSPILFIFYLHQQNKFPRG